MNPVLAILFVAGLGALEVPEPVFNPESDLAVEIALEGARSDFDQVFDSVGLSGAAPLQGLEPAPSPAPVASSTGKVPAKRARRSATSSSTIRP